MKFLFSMHGRISRLQWWLGSLVPLVIWIIAFVVIGESIGENLETTSSGRQLIAFAALTLAFISSIWINFCLYAKRYHDRGKSAFWFFICLVPFVGIIWQLIELGLLAGDTGTNEYGPPPGEISANQLEKELMQQYGGAPDAAMPEASAPVASYAQPRQPASGFGRAPASTTFGKRGQ